MRCCDANGRCRLGFSFRGSIEQGAWRGPECLGKARNDGDRWVAHPALNAAHVGPVIAGLVRQVLLRPAQRLARRTDVKTQLFPNIHMRITSRCSFIVYSL